MKDLRNLLWILAGGTSFTLIVSAAVGISAGVYWALTVGIPSDHATGITALVVVGGFVGAVFGVLASDADKEGIPLPWFVRLYE